MSLGQRPEAIQKPVARAILLARQAQAQLAEIDLRQEEEAHGDEPLPEQDPKEPQQIEDTGVSEVVLEGEIAESPFEEWLESLPLVSHLPRRARPRVLYRIDEHFAVHPLDRQEGWFSNLRYLIACAIAKHLRESRITLSAPGDWCNVPATGGDEELIALVPDEDQEKLRKRLDRPFKAFAMLLPSGDVMTVQAILDRAQKGKRATRAAALRFSATRPRELAGESWSEEDWDLFEDTQQRRKRRRGSQRDQGES